MSQLPVIIVGAGGHGVVLADALLAAGRSVLGFVEADPTRREDRPLGLAVLGDDGALARQNRARVCLVNGIGGTGRSAGAALRERVQARLERDGWVFSGVRHPSAIVSSSAVVAADAQLLAGCVVQPRARIGRAAIVNTRAVVEHDARLGDFVHVAPGAVLCGSVTVGAGTHIGAGATIRQGVTLGAGVLVGAGATVVADFDRGVLVGVPARDRSNDQ
jgi:sugar O-acyltransferase (sialic acid O-acetyltransferase NeuD family)